MIFHLTTALIATVTLNTIFHIAFLILTSVPSILLDTIDGRKMMAMTEVSE
jgi:hypothetical protein